MSESIDRINMRTMTNASVVAQYARPSELSAAEQATLARVAPMARDRPILDIGVGGGRTVEALRDGKPSTPFMSFGDTVRIEMLDKDGRSIFGAIEQRIERQPAP